MCAWECCGMLRFGFPWLSERLPAGWSRALSFSWALNFQHSHTSKIATIMDSGFHSGWLHRYIWNQGQKGIQMLYIYHIWLLQLPFWLFVGLVLACFRPWFKPTHRFRTPHYVWPRNRDAMRRQVVWRWGVENPRWIWDDQFSWELDIQNQPPTHSCSWCIEWAFVGLGPPLGSFLPQRRPGVSFAPGAVWSSSAHLGLQSIFGTTRNAHVPLAANGYCETARQETEH